MPNRRTGTDLRPSGRDSLLTPAMQAQICESVRAGNWLETAAQAAGIDRDTLFAWKRKGMADLEAGRTNSIYGVFVNAVARAEAESEQASLACIQRAGESDWRAEAWYLERRFPERWMLRQQVTVEEAKVDGLITTEFVMSPEAPKIVNALLDAFEAERPAKLRQTGLE